VSLPRRIVRKAVVVAGYPHARLTLGKRTFPSMFGSLPYLIHHYNHTWRYERCIEVPTARAFISAHRGKGLEVGNVLSHYGPIEHRVVDKYERAAGVENIDVLDVADDELSFILSVSTLEHVGWDEPIRDGEKALQALHHLRTLLRAEGRMLVTFRLGHHPLLTDAVLHGTGLGLDAESFHRQIEVGWDMISRRTATGEYDPARHDILWMGVLRSPSCPEPRSAAAVPP